MSKAIKHLVVKTTAKEEDTEHNIEAYQKGEDWEFEEETWGPVTLNVVETFDDYGEAKNKASEEVFYAAVSVYPNE